jgi:hypothetical protein
MSEALRLGEPEGWRGGALLRLFGLVGWLLLGAEGLLDGLGGGLAAPALEAVGLHGGFGGGRDADEDAAAHSAPPSKVSRTLPSFSGEGSTAMS